jgi:hypothetical protein
MAHARAYSQASSGTKRSLIVSCVIVLALVLSVLIMAAAYVHAGNTTADAGSLGKEHVIVSTQTTTTTVQTHNPTVVTVRFDMDRGYAQRSEDVGLVHVQRMPQRGGIHGIKAEDITDISIVCTVTKTDGELSIVRFPWTRDPPPPPKTSQEGDWNAWYSVYMEKGGAGVYMVISSYSVTDVLYSPPLPCTIVFTLA